MTDGWVEQTFDENGKLISQKFVAQGEIEYYDDKGEILTEPTTELYHPFDMVQPQ